MGILKPMHAIYAAIALPKVPKRVMQMTAQRMPPPLKSNRTLMSMPTPIRKYGMKTALPINSNLFFYGDTEGIYRFRIKPERKAPKMPSNPMAALKAAHRKTEAKTKINCITASL